MSAFVNELLNPQIVPSPVVEHIATSATAVVQLCTSSKSTNISLRPVDAYPVCKRFMLRLYTHLLARATLRANYASSCLAI